MSLAFVLGNGRSRLGIDPNQLEKKGKVYGCNAIYRDFLPDYLIAVDPKMVIEIDKNKIQNTTQVWTNRNSRFKEIENLNFFEPSKGWSSGPTALWLASKHENLKIYILGFDYKGINGNFFNNVYADTYNYRRSTDPATYHGNWSRQTETVIKDHPNIEYIRVVEINFLDFDWSLKYENFKIMYYEDFKHEFSL
jgi:hypothetical protein